MVLLTANINRILPCFYNYIRPYCLGKKTNSTFDFDCAIKEIFSPEEHSKILETLNGSTPENLSRYKIPKGKIKCITEWKEKRGYFKSLNEVLELQGFSEKMLEDICKRIAYNDASTSKSGKTPKHIKQLLVPDMDSNFSSSLKSAVAIHLDTTGIGWVKIGRTNNCLTEWKVDNFSNLPQKMLPSDSFKLAIDIVGKTPIADAYIFEAPQNLSPQGQTKQGLVTLYNQQIELLSMLLALLNVSVTHNKDAPKIIHNEHSTESLGNKVFYLKSLIPARLFKTLIGYEKVSAILSVTGMVKQNKDIVDLFPVTPVSFDSQLNHGFLSQSSAKKELMAQALLLGLSFMELCIHKNPNSFDALKPKNKKKEISYTPTPSQNSTFSNSSVS